MDLVEHSFFQGKSNGPIHDSESIPSICFARKTLLGLKTAIATFPGHHKPFFVGPFLAQGVFFVHNKCLQLIQNHEKPLV